MNKSKIKKIVFFIILLIIIIYISFCIYFNKLSKNIMLSSIENQGVLPEKYHNIISEENYRRMCILDYKNGYSDEKYEFDSAFTKFFLIKAESNCKFTYYRNKGNPETDYIVHDEVIIYYKFENWKWVVDDLYFYP